MFIPEDVVPHVVTQVLPGELNAAAAAVQGVRTGLRHRSSNRYHSPGAAALVVA